MKHGILWIGYGNFAKRLQPHVATNANTEILYYFYPDNNEAVRRFGQKAYWKIDEALQNPFIDIIFITTPSDRHTEYLEKALTSEKHIFVEKPITSSLADALKLLPKLKKNKKMMMVGHSMRRQSSIRRIKALLASGQFGKVVSVYINSSKGIAFDINPNHWRYSQLRHREGPLATVGIHFIDILHYLFGPINAVTAVLKNVSLKTEAPDSNAVLFTFESGMTVFLETNYNTPSDDFVYIFGTDGSIYLNRGQLGFRLGRDKNRVPSEFVPIRLQRNNILADEIKEFFNAIDHKSRIETGYQEALNALIVVEACYQSHHDRQWIKIKDVTDEYFKSA